MEQHERYSDETFSASEWIDPNGNSMRFLCRSLDWVRIRQDSALLGCEARGFNYFFDDSRHSRSFSLDSHLR